MKLSRSKRIDDQQTYVFAERTAACGRNLMDVMYNGCHIEDNRIGRQYFRKQKGSGTEARRKREKRRTMESEKK